MRWQIAGRGLIAAMLGLAWATLLPRAIGQVTAADEAAKDADRAERLAQRNRLWQAARQHAAAGDLAAAVAEAQQMVAIEIELLGEVNGEVA